MNLNAMEAEDQNVQLMEYALQCYDVKNYKTSSIWSILYQCTSENSLISSLS